ncbi:MAG: hypothetical protein JXJ04_07265 [Spirochaetales bacterium]|nr:hypothetical protein [Spirochaetales bacterium]
MPVFFLDGYKPDILARKQTPDLKKKYTFVVEIERKNHPAMTYDEKFKRIEKVFARLDLKKYGFSEHTKVLIVWNNRSFNPYWRPQEFEEYTEQIENPERQFEILVKISRNLPH